MAPLIPLAILAVGAAIMLSHNKPDSTAVPSAPTKTETVVRNGRSYFIEHFAGGLVRVTGQAAQVLVIAKTAGAAQFVSSKGQPAAIELLLKDVLPFPINA